MPLGYTGALKLPESLDSARDNVHTLGVNPAKRIFWFSGTFVGNIDLGTVIEAARLLVDNESLQFLLTGAGERDELWRKQAAGLPNVIFSGWADQHELARLAAVAWVGLGAYKKNASMSLPNKIFEYMSAELPVLISLGGETKELVTSNEIGLWFRPGDALDLSEKVQLLASDEELRNRLAKNAGVLFESQYSPSNLYDKYADFLEANAADSNSLN